MRSHRREAAIKATRQTITRNEYRRRQLPNGVVRTQNVRQIVPGIRFLTGAFLTPRLRHLIAMLIKGGMGSVQLSKLFHLQKFATLRNRRAWAAWRGVWLDFRFSGSLLHVGPSEGW